MPELPEVETIKHQLSKVLSKQIIASVEVLKQKSFTGKSDSVIGYQIIGTRRFGKVLVIDLEYPDHRSKPPVSLVIHLKMTGQLIYEQLDYKHRSKVDLSHRIVGGHPTSDFISKLPSKHTRVIFHLKAKKQQSTLYFNDQRIFGWIKIVPTSEVQQLPFIKKLGPEPSQITSEQWVKILQSSKKPIKLRLMDQHKIAGIGNIYANDALWQARINPSRPSNSLTSLEMVKLHRAVIKILNEGIKYGGATAMDGKYVDLQGLGGKYQNHFRVYQRVGKKCLRKNCNGIIQKTKINNRGTFHCPKCQK